LASFRKIHASASFWEATRIALDSLRKSKLRSFLTLLGIILATTTLISVTALIHGMNLYIADKVSNMGSDGFRIVRMAWLTTRDPKKLAIMSKRNPNIRRDEYEFIRDTARLLHGIGIAASTTARVGSNGESQEGVNVQGITENIPDLNNVQVDVGRLLSGNEVRRRAPVAFIGEDIRHRYFLDRDPIGKVIDINGLPFEVTGVAKKLGSVFGSSQDNFVMIPIGQYFKMFGPQKGISFVAKAVDQEHLIEAEDETRSLLRAFRHLRPNQEDNFGILSSDSFVSLWQELTSAIAATAIGVVSVFMLVGGIVIMNIMLAAVSERTHEIGIRKSLGARRIDILNQFLVESATLALFGGLIGVIIAWFVAVIIRNTAPVPMALPFLSILLGLGLSTTVGLFFGIYPAQQAAKLDPIEALRTER
jgi:putative ABC transport system permease protein